MPNARLCLSAILPLLFVFISCSVLAQPVKVDVKVARDSKIKMGNNRIALFGNDQKGFSILGISGGPLAGYKLELEGFNPALENTYSKSFELKDKAAFANRLGVYELGDKAYYFSKGFDPDNGNGFVYAYEVDAATGNVDVNQKPLLSSNQIAGIIKTGNKFSSSGYEFYSIAGSPNKKSLAIAFILKPQREAGTLSEVVIEMHVYKEGMKEAWTKKLTVPTTYNAVDIHSTVVTDEGELYLFIEHSDKKTARDELYHFRKADDHPAAVHVSYSEIGYVRGASLMLLQDGVAFAGLYHKSSKSDYEGFYVRKIGNDGKSSITTYPFSKENLKKNGKSDKSSFFKYLNWNGANLLDDGSMYLVAEERFTNTSSSTNISTTTWRNFNVFAAQIASDGSLMWMDQIAKRQVSPNFPEPGGIASIPLQKHMLILFNDNEKNDELDDDEAKGIILGSDKVVLSDITIDPTGKMTKRMQDLGKTYILPGTLYKYDKLSYVGVVFIGNRNFVPIKIMIK